MSLPAPDQPQTREYPEKFTQLTEDVLFADIWLRPQLSPRERSLITVSALVAMNRLEQLPFHLERANHNGLDRETLAEVITHLAFYSGWPTAASAFKRLSDLPARAPSFAPEE